MEENTIISEEIKTTDPAAEEPICDSQATENCELPLGEDEDVSEAAEASKSTEAKRNIDYREVDRRDTLELKSEFPELRDLTSITELENPMRYAELRDMGLEPREAYLATTKRVRKTDTRSHLTAAAPKSAHTPHHSLYGEELSNARALFSEMTDSEIQNLYRKVTK